MAKAENLIALGASWVSNIAASIANTDLILTSLPGPEQLKTFGENEVFPNANPGSTWIDLSTNNFATC